MPNEEFSEGKKGKSGPVGKTEPHSSLGENHVFFVSEQLSRRKEKGESAGTKGMQRNSGGRVKEASVPTQESRLE